MGSSHVTVAGNKLFLSFHVIDIISLFKLKSSDLTICKIKHLILFDNQITPFSVLFTLI